MKQCYALYVSLYSYERHDVLNHRKLTCLFNSMHRLTSKEHQSGSTLQDLCDGKPAMCDGFSHKWLVIRKPLPWNDVITIQNTYKQVRKIVPGGPVK